MRGAEVGQSEAEVGQIDPSLVSALDALRAGDLDSFSDRLDAARFPSTPAASAALRSLADSIVTEGLSAGFAPTATIDEIAATLGGRCGVVLDPDHTTTAATEDGQRPRGGQSRRAIVESGTADGESMRRELLAAYDEIARLQAERDALEARVDELAGARVLADRLAAELERDEWIRARLRRLKASRPARGLIYVRRRLRSRTSSAASR
jgi:hypothetical protein